MRRLLILLVCLCITFAAVGCDAASTTATDTTTATLPSSSTTSATQSSTTASTTQSSATTSSATIVTTTSPDVFSLAQVQADFDELVEVSAVNPKLFTDVDEFAAVVATQRALLRDGMTILEFYRVVAPVAAALRCGHTIVQAPGDAVAQFFESDLDYPIRIMIAAERLFVVASRDPDGIAVGDEILSIDGLPSAAATGAMMRFIPSDGDNETLKLRALGTDYLAYYLLFLADDDTLELTYRAADDGLVRTTVIERNVPRIGGWTPLPPVEAVYAGAHAVLTVREFNLYGTYTLAYWESFFETFFIRLENDGIRNLILDLRGNGGGDPRVASCLFSHLARTSQPYFRADAPRYYTGLNDPVPLAEPHYDGALYVLIDGFCFSTCGHFAALMAFQDVGLFIGEETGGSFVCSDNSTVATLPLTKLRFRTSRTVWAVAVEGLAFGRGVFPDIAVSPTFEDVVAGRDAVMERALGLIEAGGAS